jgi:hypothetical protein
VSFPKIVTRFSLMRSEYRVPARRPGAERYNRVVDPSGLRERVDDYRSRCLWFLRRDCYPTTPEQVLQVLRHIERHIP